MKKAKIKNLKKLFLILFSALFLCSCEKKYFKQASIILPTSQTEAQNLSVIVKNKEGNLTVFDGGRKEDAKYLANIIKENGGIVENWFLTHIHDDHIGAIYEILNKKDYNIKIKNLYYNFADINWYYEKIGNDAGIVLILQYALNEYNDFAEKNELNDNIIKIHDKIKKGTIINNENVTVAVLNDVYKIDSDPINNSSIVYKVNIDDKRMIVLGDLGYRGGEKLLSENTKEKLESDIVVLSHHGQNGVNEDVYKAIDAKIAIWPTTKKIYENIDKIYYTDDTKKWMEEIGVKKNILTFEKTYIIK